MQGRAMQGRTMQGRMGNHDVLGRMIRNRNPNPNRNHGPGAGAVADLGLDLARAAQFAIGLDLVAQAGPALCGSADDVLGAIEPDRLLVRLEDGAGGCGLAVLDRELVAAMAEIQTTGRLESRPAALRPMTRTDAALSEPLLARFLAETALAPGYAPRGKIASLRLARQLISARVLRVQEFALELGEGKRQGHLAILVPQAEPEPPEPESRDQRSDWSAALGEVVGAAPARFQAVLHRLQMPLSAACDFEVGQVVALTGSGIGSVSIEAPDGLQVARARLGQVAGRRAVRLELPQAPELAEAPIPAIDLPRDQ